MPEYVVRTRPGTTTTRVQRPGGTTRVRTRLATGGGGGGVSAHNLLSGRSTDDAHPISSITGLQEALDAAGGGGSVTVAAAVGDGGEDIDLDGAGPDDVGLVLVWGRSSGNGVYDVSVADGWVLVDPQPTTVIAMALIDGSTFMPVLNSGVWSLYTYTEGDWVALGAVPTLSGNPSQVWGPTGWVTPDSGGPDLSNAAPQDLGTAAAGVSTEASRADHVHDMPTASAVTIDASGFNGNLTTSDDTVQEVAQKLDDLVIPAAGIADPGGANDDFLQRKSGAWTNRTIAQVKTDLSVTDVNRAHRIAPASKMSSANPYSLIAPYGNGSGTLAVATGMQYLMRSPGGSGQTIERLAVHLSASALTSGQTIEVSVYDEYSGSGPGSLLWTQNITIGASTGTLYASSLSHVIPTQPFWVSVLNPSGNAGTATFRTSLVQGATVLALFWNGMPSAVLRRTAQASAASDLSSVTYREASDSPGARLEVDATGAFPLIGVLTA